MNKKRKELIERNELSRLTTYTLGGYEQKVLLDGAKADNPLLLFLHGGPGSPIPFSGGSRGMFPQFTNAFTMVYWDQLGCGINNRIIDDSFTIDSFVIMTVDLIQELKKEFPDNKLFLFGVSWGSVLAAKAASIIPELIDSVITYGQVLKNLTFHKEVFDTLKDTKLPAKVKADILTAEQNETHSIREIKTIMKYIQKYTEGYQAKSGNKTPIGPILWGLFTSPDYCFSDFRAILKNGYQKNTSLLQEMISVNLSDTLLHTAVPYLIIQGSSDIVTSTNTIFTFISSASNPNLSIQVVEKNGHMPNQKGMEAIFAQCLLLKQKAVH